VGLPALSPAAAQSPDRVSRFGEYQGYSEPLYDDWVRFSQYVPVRDGTRLAVDIFRPAIDGAPVDDPLPVIWTFHRYHRARIDREGTLTTILDQAPELKRILRYGYVVAAADVRGGGASFGTREGEFTRQEALDAKGMDGVEIAHQDDRRGVVAAAEVGHQTQRLFQRHASRKRAERTVLDGRAIGHRVAERHAEFDEVGAGGLEFRSMLSPGVGVPPGAHDVRDDRYVFWNRFSQAIHQPEPRVEPHLDAVAVGGAPQAFSAETLGCRPHEPPSRQFVRGMSQFSVDVRGMDEPGPLLDMFEQKLDHPVDTHRWRRERGLRGHPEGAAHLYSGEFHLEIGLLPSCHVPPLSQCFCLELWRKSRLFQERNTAGLSSRLIFLSIPNLPEV
jgi:hypothetical protein